MWGDRYTYEKSVYTTNKAKVVVTCPIHGDFDTIAYDFLKGHGCPDCGIESLKQKRRLSQDEFIAQCKAIHGNRYDYSKVVYVNNKTNVTVICPDHGPFEVMPQDHIQKKNGCPKCQTSKGETAIHVWLDAHGIKHDWHKPIRTPMAIGKRKKFVADFYIESLNTIIEYNGEQHYRAKKEWGGDKQLKWQQARDAALRRYCEAEGIRLLEIPYTNFDQIEEILDREL